MSYQVNAGQWFLQVTCNEVAELLLNGARAVFALDLLYWILILGSCHFSSILAVWHTWGGDKSLCSTAFKSLYGNSTQQPNKSQRHPGSIPLWKQPWIITEHERPDPKFTWNWRKYRSALFGSRCIHVRCLPCKSSGRMGDKTKSQLKQKAAVYWTKAKWTRVMPVTLSSSCRDETKW